MKPFTRQFATLVLLTGINACSSDGAPAPGSVSSAGTSSAGAGAAGNSSPNVSAGTGGISSAAGNSSGGASGSSAMTLGGNSGAGEAGGNPAGAGGTGGAAQGGGSGNGGSNSTDPGNAGDGDFTVPSSTTQPDLTDRGAPKGQTFTFTMDSTKSTIFDGSDKTLTASKRSLTRLITVYVPAQYKDGTPAPMLVMQDGPDGTGANVAPVDAVSRALDNLTIATDPTRRIPAFIVIAIQSGGSDAQGSERGLEYDTMSDRYARFVQMEVLPAVLSDAKIKAAHPGLAFTNDPEGKGTYGCSSGGAAAFTMAWFRPDLFRRAITYSGTFVAQQDTGQPEAVMYPLGAWEYHSSTEIIANTTPKKPIRVHLNANGMDNGYNAPESGHHNWLLANQRMAAVMKSQGYHYRYDFVPNIGHCSASAWRATLADTLIWLWRGYAVN